MDLQRNNSDIELDSDDLSGDMNLSDCEDGASRRFEHRMKRENKRKGKKNKKKHVFRQEFDTNVFEVALACLEHKGQVATGDPEICAKCKAVFNQGSKIQEVQGHQLWICEFCNHRNEVMLEEEEIPKSMEVTYLVEAAA